LAASVAVADLKERTLRTILASALREHKLWGPIGRGTGSSCGQNGAALAA